MVIAPAWRSVLQRLHLDLFDAIARLDQGHLVKDRRSIQVRRVVLPEGQTLFVKLYWANNFLDVWGGLFRGILFGPSKVQREYENIERLRRWNLDAPTPIGYGEQHCAGFLTRSFLMTEGIKNPVPLDRVIQQGIDDPRRRALITGLADTVRQMHQHGFVHHDLYWRNIILNDQSLDRFYLIDCHKGRTWSRREEIASRAHDLACLDAPAPEFFRRTDRLRFFLRYREHSRLTDDDKKLLRRALEMAAPMRDRQLKRVRETRG